MLLVHQEGSVRVGEVVRYTLTYTPTEDRILPTPSQLHVRVKNTTAIPYRAAYLVGPYTVHASAYPSSFTPYKKLENPGQRGVPQFEPNLKAGGHFHAKLTIPDEIKESGDREWLHGRQDGTPKSVTWVIEIASQILFSQSASVHYELLVARDERSLDTGFAALASRGHGEPGKVHDVVQFQVEGSGRNPAPKGVYSRAIELVVQDTAQLWNTPPLPQWPEEERDPTTKRRSWKVGLRGSTSHLRSEPREEDQKTQMRKKIHLVVLTHGLHSNVGADMLYLKESIDATVKQAREDSRKRKAEMRRQYHKAASVQKQRSGLEEGSRQETSTAPLSGGQEDLPETKDTLDDEDDEQVIVRGFSGNVTRTEKGIQYLGKRLAKFILTMTYPDQPFLPVAKSMTRTLSNTFTPNSTQPRQNAGKPVHAGSSVHRSHDTREKLPYTFTSISFIGHSLGGLIQLYAIGYIRKHSPEFFDKIKPVNFVTLAAPLLGLSNENPLYIKFALDFGLVGRTGQDLGLTWRAPTIARSGWSAMIAGLGGGQEKEEKKPVEDPRAKPLLRILPSGPAHHVLKQFRNRTVYANVVNDGIVPLRTSCLLFLDWRGLDRVQNARRENGLLGTMAQFGWAELTGANTISHAPYAPVKHSTKARASESNIHNGETSSNHSKELEGLSPPLPASPAPHQFLSQPLPDDDSSSSEATFLSPKTDSHTQQRTASPSRLEEVLNFFRPAPPAKRVESPPHMPRQNGHQSSTSVHKVSRKATERMHRAQTIRPSQSEPNAGSPVPAPSEKPSHRPAATRGDSIILNPGPESSGPPPKTSIFEAASDIMNPPIPTPSWIADPDSRSRSIFHDRIYHPEDIPPPPQKKSRSVSSLARSLSSDSLKTRSGGTGSTHETLPSTGSNSPNTSPSLFRRKSDHQSPSTWTSSGTNDYGHRTRTECELGAHVDSSGMSVEEKIARAYHRDLSWRKVLVRLEPDAHNNMIVRRMFANAYGWDVVRHLCEVHFADTYEARTEDKDELGEERVEDQEESSSEQASQHDSKQHSAARARERGLGAKHQHTRTQSELQEMADQVPEMVTRGGSAKSSGSKGTFIGHRESVAWNDDEFFSIETDDDWDGDAEMR